MAEQGRMMAKLSAALIALLVPGKLCAPVPQDPVHDKDFQSGTGWIAGDDEGTRSESMAPEELATASEIGMPVFDVSETRATNNAILFLGGGWMPAQGARQHLLRPLAWEEFEHHAKVQGEDLQDKTSVATATLAGAGQDPPSSARCDDKQDALSRMAEWAKSRGMGVGLVTNTKLTQSTPGGCEPLSNQLLRGEPGWDVVLGGGRGEVVRKGGLLKEWLERTGGSLVESAETLQQTGATQTPLLGLFGDEAMGRAVDRNSATPALADLTRKAIGILSDEERFPNHYLLLVDGGERDAAVQMETLEMDQAVRQASRSTRDTEDTLLLVVTAEQLLGRDVGGSFAPNRIFFTLDEATRTHAQAGADDNATSTVTTTTAPMSFFPHWGFFVLMAVVVIPGCLSEIYVLSYPQAPESSPLSLAAQAEA